MMPLTHIPDAHAVSSQLSIEDDNFLDTCNRVKCETPSGILTYLDFDYEFSQDHIGLRYMVSKDVFQLSAFTKFVSASARYVGIMEENSSPIDDSRPSRFLGELRRIDRDFLQEAVYEKYVELGKIHLSETEIRRKLKIESGTDVLQALHLGRMHISLKQQLSSRNFLVIGERAYNMLLGTSTFFNSVDCEFEKKIYRIGEIGTSCEVFFHKDHPEALLIGNKVSQKGGCGVYLFENPKMLLEEMDPSGRRRIKMKCCESVGEYGNFPWFSYFAPEIEW